MIVDACKSQEKKLPDFRNKIDYVMQVLCVISLCLTV